MKNLEESIYNKLIEKEKKPNPKDHTTLSIEDMETAVQKAASSKKVAGDKKKFKSVGADEYRKLPTVSDKFDIVMPKTKEASCKYGAGTKWCTAAAEDNQFNRYHKNWGMNIYYILPKKVDPDWNIASAEETAATEDEFAHFFTEGKVQDLQKKYPAIDVTALKDPSGKNKYLAWMAKTVDGIGAAEHEDVWYGTTERSRTGATARVNNVIDYYHKLLPYIGREEKPEKKKEKGQRQDQTRFDKLAIVMSGEGYRTKMYDAKDKDVELKDVISYIMPTWGIDAKEGLDVFEKIENVIDADMKENPNPANLRREKLEKEVTQLRDDSMETYKTEFKPFFRNPQNAKGPYAYGIMRDATVKVGSLVLPWNTHIYLPLPTEYFGYEILTKDQTFRGNDRGRMDDFRNFLKGEMNLHKYPQAMFDSTSKTYNKSKEKNIKDLQAAAAARTYDESFPREATVDIVGDRRKQMFAHLQMPAKYWINDRAGNLPDEEQDELLSGIVKDVRNFFEKDIDSVANAAWEEFQFLAKRWMEQNPRKSPEEEKTEVDKVTDDIMDQLPEERQTMSLEEKILKRLMGEELLLEAVDYAQAQASLTGKPAQKLVKSFNFDQGKDPMDNMSKLVTTIRNQIMTSVPHDVLPADISNDPSVTAIKKEEEIEDRRAIGIMWMLRLLKKDKELTATLLGDDPTHRWQSISRALRQNLEKFFQHPRHMKVRSLDQIPNGDELANVVDAAQKSIDAENDKKMGADAGQGTEFFAGGFKTDENGDIVRDEEGIPLFRFSKDGWVIAAAHNKGAACLLGKKTNWCTAAPGLNYFDTYYNGTDDPLFFIHTPADERGDGDRFQFAFGCDDCPQFMDVEDTPVRGEEFERLHQKLKDVLEDNGLEDRFDVVFNYEHFDFHEAMDILVTSERARIDNPQVQIHGDVEDDYDSTNLSAGFNVAFVYSFDPNKFTPVDDIHDYDGIINVFNEITNMQVGAQEDNYGEDGQENVDYDAGHSTIKLEIGGWMTSWASSESRGQDSMYEIDGFFSDVNSKIDGMYDELKGKLQVALTELGALPLTEYDKLLSDDIQVWDGEHANQDDEDESEPKDKAERQEAFEEQFKNVLVAFDVDLSEITFQGLSFPPPAELASDKVSIIGHSPRNKDYILRRALKTMQQVIDRQPGLPGFTGADDDSAYLDMFRNVVSRNDIVGFFHTAGTVCKIEIEMKLGVLTESEMDTIVAGMKVIDKHFKLFQISMRDALERYIKMNPNDVRWEKDKAEPPQDAAQRGAPIGARLGNPVRAEGISEIVADEVTKAMNEIEPYQKIAKKQQKKAMELSIKGTNKYMAKGMKIATAKPGKSAPPGA